jgi:phage portal protein BeeE
MKIFGYNIGKKAVNEAQPSGTTNSGDVDLINRSNPIMKAYIPEWLYKPPFGYPRKENIPLIRQLAKNPYVYAVVKTLCDQIASTDWDITLKDGVEMTPELERMREEMIQFFDNPNENKESFSDILRAVAKDIFEVDAGVIIKVFNQYGQMQQIFARDGGSFLKNPDIHGYMGNREDFIEAMDINHLNQMYGERKRDGQGNVLPPDQQQEKVHQMYDTQYSTRAAYFQYGAVAMALPVPFGRREVVYISQNPQSNSIYGLSPIQILADIITNLVYGSMYNLDFFMNNNMPEGMIQMIGADSDQITALRQRLDNVIREEDPITGFTRRTGFKIPIYNQEVKFTPFQLDPKAMQLIESQSWWTKIVWAAFGMTPDEMGFTENSNKAVSETQGAVYKRKAIKPLLKLFKYRIDKEIIPEWGDVAFRSLEFKFDDYDLDEDLKKHSLYKMQLDMGINTPKLIAEEEGIDYSEIESYKEEEHEREVEKMQVQARQNNFNNPEQKSFDNDLEEELVTGIKKRSKELMSALDGFKKGALNEIR